MADLIDEPENDGRWFFGWKNFKWFVREIRKIYSKEDSYFSKKRIESGFAFLVMEWGLIHWLVVNINKIDYIGIVAWCGVNAVICGYTLTKIQEEKNGNNQKAS